MKWATKNGKAPGYDEIIYAIPKTLIEEERKHLKGLMNIVGAHPRGW